MLLMLNIYDPLLALEMWRSLDAYRLIYSIVIITNFYAVCYYTLKVDSQSLYKMSLVSQRKELDTLKGHSHSQHH